MELHWVPVSQWAKRMAIHLDKDSLLVIHLDLLLGLQLDQQISGAFLCDHGTHLLLVALTWLDLSIVIFHFDLMVSLDLLVFSLLLENLFPCRH